jgi:glycosyltransferase involved in cell wall biosynthesis
VAHFGAHLHYAIPVVLDQHQALAGFYTDFYMRGGRAAQSAGRVIDRLPFKSLRRAISRNDERLPRGRIHSFEALGIAYVLSLQLAKSSKQRARCFRTFDILFGNLVAGANWKGANTLFTLNDTALEVFKESKKRGVACILEQTIAPYPVLNRLLSEEIDLWPDWQQDHYEPVDGWLVERGQEEQALADGILTGSSFVSENLALTGIPREKCFVVPYTVDVNRFTPQNPLKEREKAKRPLRILFLGGVDLRKGIQYLHEGLKLLDPEAYQAKAVGGITLHPEAVKKLSQTCTLTGQIPRQDIPGILQWADVFVFPSICEGSALVTYEAAAAGLPVITTPNAGSMIRDGVDGFLVPIRNAEAIAERLEILRKDPELRVSMAQEARAGAEKTLSWEAFADRLMAAFHAITGRSVAFKAIQARRTNVR